MYFSREPSICCPSLDSFSCWLCDLCPFRRGRGSRKGKRADMRGRGGRKENRSSDIRSPSERSLCRRWAVYTLGKNVAFSSIIASLSCFLQNTVYLLELATLCSCFLGFWLHIQPLKPSLNTHRSEIDCEAYSFLTDVDSTVSKEVKGSRISHTV